MQLYNCPKYHGGKCAGGGKAQEAANKNANSRIRTGTPQIHKKISRKMKIFAIQQKRTLQGRRKSQQNNRERSYSDHKRKQNQEIHVKQQKTNQQNNITSPLKESTQEKKTRKSKLS